MKHLLRTLEVQCVMRQQALLALGVIALLLVAGCSSVTQSAQAPVTPGESNSSDGVIQVTGVGSAEAQPTQAVIRVGVQVLADDAVTARQRLAENTSRMRAALESIGITSEQISTTRYGLHQDRHRPREASGEPQVQYRAFHGFEITVNQTDRVGTIIDTAVANGATEVHNIQLTLSTRQRRELQATARTAAMQDARLTARQYANAANLTITGVQVIQTTRRRDPRMVEAALTLTTAAGGGGGQTDIESGPRRVVTTVHVVYTTEPATNAS